MYARKIINNCLIVFILSLFSFNLCADERAWCEACQDWVKRRGTSHDDCLGNAELCQDCGNEYVLNCEHKMKKCDVCGEYYKGTGAHIGCPVLKCKGCGKEFLIRDGEKPSSFCPDCENKIKEDIDHRPPDDLPIPDLPIPKNLPREYIYGLLGLVLVLMIVVALPKHKKRTKKVVPKRKFTFVDGVPQGIELLPGKLVVSTEVLGGGTAEGRFAMMFDGAKWNEVFVKRIIGSGMRDEMRRPVLDFEANVLKRLAGSGFAPELLEDTHEEFLGKNEKWLFFAMSIVSGTPWPDYGGLGDETQTALMALCEALMVCHERGIGHHDLKPGNIYYNQTTKRVTLLDFGSAIDDRGELVNPLGNAYPKTLPWVAPDGDGSRLAELRVVADNFVYGLLFLEATLGCIHTQTIAARRSATNPADREFMRGLLAERYSKTLADAVIDGLLALDYRNRMKLRVFLEILRAEWKVM